MSVTWEREGTLWYLDCDLCQDTFSCTHTYDLVTTPGVEIEFILPEGRIRFPLAGEFPVPGIQVAMAQMTREELGYFDIEVSKPINSYGTRKVSLTTFNEPIFLMTFNPEDALVSIYITLLGFIDNQVIYPDGDKFESCRGNGHTVATQTILAQLNLMVTDYPMLKTWDLLSKLTTNTCVVCMWKRTKPVPADAGTSAFGLGNL